MSLAPATFGAKEFRAHCPEQGLDCDTIHYSVPRRPSKGGDLVRSFGSLDELQ